MKHGDYTIRAYKIRAPRHQMLLFSIMFLQNCPVFKYSLVTRGREVKLLTKTVAQGLTNLRTNRNMKGPAKK